MKRHPAVSSCPVSLGVSIALLSALLSPASRAIDDVQVNFTSIVVAGTCQAQLTTRDGAILTDGTLAFGDVYKSQVQQGTAWQNFFVSFSHCQGVGSATVQASAGANGLCNGVTFGGAGDLTGVAAEIYRDADGGGAQLNCSDTMSSTQTVDPNTTADMPFSTRLVVAPGKTQSDLHSGSFSAPVTFTVNYQ